MNKRTEQAFCLALLIFSVVVRGCCTGGFQPDALLRLFAPEPDEPAPAEVWTLELLSAARQDGPDEAPEPPPEPGENADSGEMPKAEEETDSGDAPKEEISAEPEAGEKTEREIMEEPQPENTEKPEPLVFDPSEADRLGVGGREAGAVDRRALLCRDSKLDFSAEGPKVLIVHTHSSEAYTPEPGWEYTESDELRTEQPEFSVIRVGSRVAELLNAAGIETLHDTALNDYPVYGGSYDRMLKTVEDYLARYPSVQMVLDIHRDAASNPDGTPFAAVSEQDGERCARVMLVIGTDGCGMPHPDWQENLANALKLQALLERDAPGLCRDLDLRTERFNQHTTPGSMILEFGSTGNTLQEALRSADHVADALITLIRGVQGE